MHIRLVLIRQRSTQPLHDNVLLTELRDHWAGRSASLQAKNVLKASLYADSVQLAIQVGQLGPLTLAWSTCDDY